MQFKRQYPARRFRWSVIGTVVSVALALSAHNGGPSVTGAAASEQGGASTAPTLATLPAGYRDWPLVSVATVGGPVNDIRAKLANDIAIRAYRDGKLPFPDGAVIARLAWFQVQSKENNDAFRAAALAQGLSAQAVQKLLDASFVAGPAENVQLMVKDAKKFASTGGWGFAQFTNGKPDNVAVQTCFACHGPASARDFVFTHYTP